MGIVNVTPDSFSDGGQFFRPEEAIRRARNLIEDGADIVDLGGESTRPGATPLGWEEEWARIEPVLRTLKATRVKGVALGAKVSVDTYHPETAERAIAAGADIVNCVRAESVPAMLKLLEGNDVELVLPASCLVPPAQLPNSSNQAIQATVPSSLVPRLYLDPMIGFGTTREEDLALLRSIPALAQKGRVLVGASRKRIVKKLVGAKCSVGKDVGGNVAVAMWAAMNGASVVRVHDVKETVQALKVLEALNGGGATADD